MGNCQYCCNRASLQDLNKSGAEECELHQREDNMHTPYKVKTAVTLTTGTIGRDVSPDITRPSMQGFQTSSQHLGTGIKYELDNENGQNLIVPQYDSNRESGGFYSNADFLLETPSKNTMNIKSPQLAGKSLTEIAKIKALSYLRSVENPKKLSIDSQTQYEGQVENCKPSGKGVLTKNQSDIYLGFFKNLRPVYKVEHFSLIKGTHYIGLLNDDLNYDGFGTLTFHAKNHTYSGEFKDGLPHGEGQETEDVLMNTVYVGEFKLGQRTNKGMIIRLSDGMVVKTFE